MSSETPPADLSAELSAPRATSALAPSRETGQDLTKHINGVRERLSKEFLPALAPEVVSHEVDVAVAGFSDARVKTYIPVLVNRQVRLKLRQLVSAA
ncbi:hypothetical protein acdb102_11110 [Acidothermaceae bacterium B102]|nr:hypothetical protein acdb102_11110 [Acidothermaceae bacterium B102]